jgi:hypothetical protein
VELLDPHSVPLAKELTELDKQTYKEGKADDDGKCSDT